jgi:hypothetical protein
MTPIEVEGIVNGYLSDPTRIGRGMIRDAIRRAAIEMQQWLGVKASGRGLAERLLDLVPEQDNVPFGDDAFKISSVERMDRGQVPLPLPPIPYESRSTALAQGHDGYTHLPGRILLVIAPTILTRKGLRLMGYPGDVDMSDVQEEFTGIPLDLQECIAAKAMERLAGQRGVEWVSEQAAMAFVKAQAARFIRFLGDGRPKPIRPSHTFHSPQRRVRRWWW